MIDKFKFDSPKGVSGDAINEKNGKEYNPLCMTGTNWGTSTNCEAKLVDAIGPAANIIREHFRVDCTSSAEDILISNSPESFFASDITYPSIIIES